MNYKYKGYNRLLVADLYHWETDDIGNLLIKPNNEAKTRGDKNGLYNF